MSTRGFVGVMLPSGHCRAIYVHYDCYLDGVGAALQIYKTQGTVEELISHGDRSSLEDGFYKDRGETGVDPELYESFDEFYDAASGAGAEYYYIFLDGVWYCGDTYDRTPISRKLVAYKDAVELMRKYAKEQGE